jgi:hypothetical protein
MIPQLKPMSSLDQKCISDCILVHENVHIDDIIALGYGSICKGQPYGEIVNVPTAEALASERKAFAAELACLQKKLQGLSGCDECRSDIQNRISFIQPFLVNPPNE